MKLKKLIHHIDSETKVYVTNNGRVLVCGHPKSIVSVNPTIFVNKDTTEEVNVLEAKVKDISIAAPDYSLRLEVKL